MVYIFVSLLSTLKENLLKCPLETVSDIEILKAFNRFAQEHHSEWMFLTDRLFSLQKCF